MHATRPYLRPQEFANPRGIERLLCDPRSASLWFALRLYVGWQWLYAGWHKFVGTSSLGWVQSGTAGGKTLHHGDKLLAFWQQAAEPPKGGVPQVGYPWYRDFLLYLIQHHCQTVFAYLIPGGEFLVGLALMLGAFTAVASLAGATLNFNYMLAGSASINPVLFAAEILLILAWKSAGYIGLDRWLLPALGTPWQPGSLFRRAPGRGPAFAAGSAARHSAGADRRPQQRAVRPRRRRRLGFSAR